MPNDRLAKMKDKIQSIIEILNKKNEGTLDVPIVMLKELLKDAEQEHTIELHQWNEDGHMQGATELRVNDIRITSYYGHNPQHELIRLCDQLHINAIVKWKE